MSTLKKLGIIILACAFIFSGCVQPNEPWHIVDDNDGDYIPNDRDFPGNNDPNSPNYCKVVSAKTGLCLDCVEKSDCDENDEDDGTQADLVKLACGDLFADKDCGDPETKYIALAGGALLGFAVGYWVVPNFDSIVDWINPFSDRSANVYSPQTPCYLGTESGCNGRRSRIEFDTNSHEFNIRMEAVCVNEDKKTADCTFDLNLSIDPLIPVSWTQTSSSPLTMKSLLRYYFDKSKNTISLTAPNPLDGKKKTFTIDDPHWFGLSYQSEVPLPTNDLFIGNFSNVANNTYPRPFALQINSSANNAVCLYSPFESWDPDDVAPLSYINNTWYFNNISYCESNIRE